MHVYVVAYGGFILAVFSTAEMARRYRDDHAALWRNDPKQYLVQYFSVDEHADRTSRG